MKVKKRIKDLKTSAVSRLKQMKHGQMSLQVKMLFLLSVFAATLGGVNILNMVVGAQLIFGDHYASQLANATIGVRSDIVEGSSAVETFMDGLEQTHPTELDTLRRGYPDPIAEVLNEVTTTAAYYGYFITRPDGTVTACSDGNTGLNTGMIATEVIDEMEGGRFKGIANVCNFGLCQIVVRTINQKDGTPAANIGVILSNLSDSSFIDGLKTRYQVEVGLVRNGSFTHSTVRADNGERLTGVHIDDTEVTDTLYKAHKTFEGRSEIAGRGFRVIYAPIINKQGHVTNTLFTGIELSRAQTLIGYLTLAMFLGGWLFSTIVIAVVFIHVRKHITTPIRSVSESARLIAEKDLTHDVTLFTTGDEIEVLAASVYDMQDSLRDTLEEVQEAANALRTQSQEISRASLAISDGANSQASSLEEIASSVEEMTSIISQNTENSKKTDHLMSESDKAIANITEISSASMAASRKIASAIRNINALVSQTNILSLNASVEAARAGSQGRGFAVVAREVGRLAEQTKGTAASVSETAEASIEAAEKVDAKLDEVTPQLHEVADLMKEITASSIEQGQGAEHINTAIAELNKTTQQNAAGAEELAASAEELASSADILNQVAMQFKVK